MNPSGRNVISFSLLYHCKRTFTRSKRARYNTIPRMLLPSYCPQTKLREGNVFTPVWQGGGGLSGSGSGRYASGSRGCTPLVTHPTGHPLPQHNPIGHWTRNPLDPHNPLDIPLWTHLRDSHPSPLRSTCGQYASYWNAFWFFKTVLCWIEVI